MSFLAATESRPIPALRLRTSTKPHLCLTPPADGCCLDIRFVTTTPNNRPPLLEPPRPSRRGWRCPKIISQHYRGPRPTPLPHGRPCHRGPYLLRTGSPSCILRRLVIPCRSLRPWSFQIPVGGFHPRRAQYRAPRNPARPSQVTAALRSSPPIPRPARSAGTLGHTHR